LLCVILNIESLHPTGIFMKKLLSLFAIAIFASSSFASEHINLRDEMMAMGQRLSFATRAQSAEEIQTNLNALIEAAERSKTIMPVKWQGDTSQFAGYQQGLQKVIDTRVPETLEVTAGHPPEAPPGQDPPLWPQSLPDS